MKLSSHLKRLPTLKCALNKPTFNCRFNKSPRQWHYLVSYLLCFAIHRFKYDYVCLTSSWLSTPQELFCQGNRRSVCYRTYLLAATAQNGADKLKIATCFICTIPRDHIQKLVPLWHLWKTSFCNIVGCIFGSCCRRCWWFPHRLLCHRKQSESKPWMCGRWNKSDWKSERNREVNSGRSIQQVWGGSRHRSAKRKFEVGSLICVVEKMHIKSKNKNFNSLHQST